MVLLRLQTSLVPARREANVGTLCSRPGCADTPLVDLKTKVGVLELMDALPMPVFDTQWGFDDKHAAMAHCAILDVGTRNPSQEASNLHKFACEELPHQGGQASCQRLGSAGPAACPRISRLYPVTNSGNSRRTGCALGSQNGKTPSTEISLVGPRPKLGS